MAIATDLIRSIQKLHFVGCTPPPTPQMAGELFSSEQLRPLAQLPTNEHSKPGHYDGQAERVAGKAARRLPADLVQHEIAREDAGDDHAALKDSDGHQRLGVAQRQGEDEQGTAGEEEGAAQQQVTATWLERVLVAPHLFVLEYAIEQLDTRLRSECVPRKQPCECTHVEATRLEPAGDTQPSEHEEDDRKEHVVCAGGRSAKKGEVLIDVKLASSCEPNTPVRIVPMQMSTALSLRSAVSGSPSVHGASSTFHTITSPAQAVMMEAAANEYAATSKAGSMKAVKKKPMG
eukprot:CAMPEP_0119355124 /NCGR_PEP_ID=MMETSP1334-20130426/4000_1 /TAXON_ID=127549 /ORGANISM="Calcidiscus leptoporus, Strain RCC1130" /LENGTH=289 /DNA_ID=CAMNT_0007368849 /DNA_START=472 /DNA_END=1345 /DNA_ORIENTATION=+